MLLKNQKLTLLPHPSNHSSHSNHSSLQILLLAFLYSEEFSHASTIISTSSYIPFLPCLCSLPTCLKLLFKILLVSFTHCSCRRGLLDNTDLFPIYPTTKWSSPSLSYFWDGYQPGNSPYKSCTSREEYLICKILDCSQTRSSS